MTKETPLATGFLISLGYIAVTLPFGATDFLGRGLYAGPSCCFLFIMGLLFGRTGVWGCLVGCLCGILFPFKGIQAALFQISTAAWLSIFPQTLWYIRKDSRQVALCTVRDFAKYITISLLASAGVGFLYRVCFKSPGQVAEAAGFTFFWCIAAGIPTIILMLSILGIQVRCPSSAQIPDDLELHISGQRDEIGLINDRIETLCTDKGVDLKTTYRLMSCLEELLLRIIENDGEFTDVRIHVRIRETIIISVTNCGMHYNPLKINSREQMEDLIGLKLIRQMSLRASYRRVRGENQIKVVM